MSNKFVLILLAVAVIISGCVFDKNGATNPRDKPDLIPQTDLPAGFAYMGVHETPVDIGGSFINATEGIYRNNGEDFYIQVIENSNPEALITTYKLQYQDAKYNPFKEISLNGHKATQVTDYTTVNGKQLPNYAVIWTTEKAMILVSSPTADAQAVTALAAAVRT
jgi:hypothetical protein